MAGHLPPTARRVATLSSQLPRLRFSPKTRPAGTWTINYAVEVRLEVLLMVFRSSEGALLTGTHLMK